MTWRCCGTAGWAGSSPGVRPSTLGSFLRAFTFGHVRQLDAVASRFLTGLAGQAPLLARRRPESGVLVDVDDTIIEVHGYAKQGAGFGYSGVRGLERAAGHRHHRRVGAGDRGASGCARARAARRAARNGWSPTPSGHRRTGAARCRAGAAAGGLGVLRPPTWSPPLGRAGAQVSVTVRHGPRGQGRDRHHRRGRVDHDRVPDAVFDEDTGGWVSDAEVAEIPFTAFTSRRKQPSRSPAGWSCAASRTCNPSTRRARPGHPVRRLAVPRRSSPPDPADADTVAADKTHRGHAIIEQVHADLKNSALAHLPSGKFTANAAWLVLAVIAFNLTRAAATLAGPAPGQGDHRHHPPQADHRPGPDRAPPPDGSPCTCHARWPWETAWTQLFDRRLRATTAAAPPDHPAADGPHQDPERTDSEAGHSATP